MYFKCGLRYDISILQNIIEVHTYLVCLFIGFWSKYFQNIFVPLLKYHF